MTNRRLDEIVRRRQPVTLPVSATVQDACKAMRDRRVGAILVTDPEGRLAGLVTGRDVVTRVAAEGLDSGKTCLAMVMTVQPDALAPQAHAIDALRMMQDGGYRHMPVVEDGHVVGIVSAADFLGLERARLDDETGFWEVL